MPSQRYSNEDIFDRLERLRVEVKGDIQINYNSLKQDVQGLRSDFNTLEAGRLTAVEQRTNTLEKNQGIQNNPLKWFLFHRQDYLLILNQHLK